MTSQEIRQRFLDFFKEREHAIIPSASLIPENDPTVLFNTAGMQPLVPFLMGSKHPNGDKLVNVQKCIRTTDIDDIGDNTHATFFEMLGNWSLGSYFKKEAIAWSYEFLTSKETGLGLNPSRLYVTVFEGDENSPKDTESAEIWRSVGIPEKRIFYKGKDANWWPAVKGKDTWTGPTGPNTEMFYDITGTVGDLNGISDFDKADSEQKIVEVWNDVFMEFEKREGKIVGKLSQKNVDTGAGLERLAMVMQMKNNIFETDLLKPIVSDIESKTTNKDQKDVAEIDSNTRTRNIRIIADHLRTSVFLISDGVLPSNTDRGYILRRLIRRAVRLSDLIGIPAGEISKVADTIPKIYSESYPNVKNNIESIKSTINDEEEKFRKTLTDGLREFNSLAKKGNITGKEAFILFSSFGFPLDITVELAKERGVSIDTSGFSDELKNHQELSRTGAIQKFKGGLADTSENSIKYHTATHLLNAALKFVLGAQIEQRGSNITSERLRFDFSHPQKLTEEEKQLVENTVNSKINENLTVTSEEMPLEKAREIGAVGVFGEKYGDVVKVYSIGNKDKSTFFSREICGGPHVENTGTLGKFKILKEEAVSSGVRRIKAVLE